MDTAAQQWCTWQDLETGEYWCFQTLRSQTPLVLL